MESYLKKIINAVKRLPHNAISKYAKECKDPLLGYCFYHEQDTKLAEKTGTLMLSFGSLYPEGDDIQIGKTIVEILRQYNLNVSWTVDTTQRILVTLPLPILFLKTNK